jgi:PAS domain S-box-containing protein
MRHAVLARFENHPSAASALSDDDVANAARSRLSAIVESSDDAILSKNTQGIITSWNAAAERMFGYTAEEMLGASILKIIPYELRGEEEMILSRVRAGEKVDHFETVRMRKDGTRIQVSVTVSPVKDAAGRIIGASKIARDIGTQRELTHARSTLVSIVESSDDAIVSKDLDGIVTSWNRAAERLYGYPAEEMIGQPIRKIIPPELQTEEDMILATIREGRGIDHFETTRMHKDGSRLLVSITISPIRDERGRVVGASKIARDIGRTRELNEARAMLAAIVASSDDAIISKDLEGRVMSWNRAAERLYGYDASEMMGESIRKIIPPALHYEEDDILAKIRAGERVDHIETTRMRKDGSLFEVSITVSPVKDENGRIVGASKIARDITPQREAQREKDRFLAILAHELRNPLAPIRNAITLFGRPGMKPEHLDKAREIAERQVAHMAQLLDDLLDVARISTGRVELKKADIPLKPIINHAVEALRPMMAQRGHRLDVTVPTEEVWIHGDEVRILQIVSNLLTNAAKYTDRGGEVRLSLAREGDRALIRVEDTGIGFDPSAADHLFKLFSQAKDVSQRAEGGLGIGLALVREFVERHGGTVTAESPGPGRGSRFTVDLPVVPAPAG